MDKKYIGKLKSFKELMCMADDVDKEGDLMFNTNIESKRLYFENTEKQTCGTEIIIFPITDSDFHYVNGIGTCRYRKQWFSEIKEVEDNGVWKSTTDYNCWKTKEEAETVEKSMKLYRAMKRWSFDNDNGYEFVYGEENWYIYFSENKIFEIDFLEFNKYISTVYFSSEEKAEKCLEWLKKENLL